MRGKDAYYDSTHSLSHVGPLQVRLGGGGEYWCVLSFDFTWRRGRDQDEISDLVKERDGVLKDALIMELSGLSADDLLSLDGKYRLKRRFRDLLEGSLFAKQEARVDSIWFSDFLVQATR